MYWTTENGDKIKYEDLETRHLRNILRFIERKAEGGATSIIGDVNGYFGDRFADFITYSEDEVLGRYDYYSLRKELENRLGV